MKYRDVKDWCNLGTEPRRERWTVSYPRVFNPEDWLRFVELSPFSADWKDLGLIDEDLRWLQLSIMLAPKGAPVIPGTGGLRKMRFVPPRWHQGKRGAMRVCYAYFPDYSVVILAAAYGKNEKEDITQRDKKAIRKLLKDIEEWLSREK